MPCNCIILRLHPWELASRREPDGSTRHDRECCYYATPAPRAPAVIYNVSIVQTPDDNGICVSFTEAAQAHTCATQARQDGAFFVREWSV